MSSQVGPHKLVIPIKTVQERESSVTLVDKDDESASLSPQTACLAGNKRRPNILLEEQNSPDQRAAGWPSAQPVSDNSNKFSNGSSASVGLEVQENHEFFAHHEGIWFKEKLIEIAFNEAMAETELACFLEKTSDGTMGSARKRKADFFIAWSSTNKLFHSKLEWLVNHYPRRLEMTAMRLLFGSSKFLADLAMFQERNPQADSVSQTTEIHCGADSKSNADSKAQDDAYAKGCKIEDDPENDK